MIKYLLPILIFTLSAGCILVVEERTGNRRGEPPACGEYDWGAVDCQEPKTLCTDDSQCDRTSYCDEQSETCIPSDRCSADSDCWAGSICSTRNVCEPAPCQSSADCLEGCYCDAESSECIETGYCDQFTSCEGDLVCDLTRNTCEPPPELNCDDFDNDEAGCIAARPTCDALYVGINCTDPNGVPCTSDQSNCTCESFTYGDCVTTTTDP